MSQTEGDQQSQKFLTSQKEQLYNTKEIANFGYQRPINLAPEKSENGGQTLSFSLSTKDE